MSETAAAASASECTASETAACRAAMSAARRWEKDEGGDASAARPVAIVLIVGLVRMAGFFIAT